MATIRLCDVEGCEVKYLARGLCSRHYHAAYRATDAGRAVVRAKQARYQATDAGKAVDKAAKARCRATQAGKDARWWDNGMHRARKAGAVIGYVPRDTRSIIYEAFGTTCLAPDCGSVAAIDHVIALADGGPHDLANLQPLCGSHNSAKGKADTDYRPDAGRVIIAAIPALTDGLTFDASHDLQKGVIA